MEFYGAPMIWRLFDGAPMEIDGAPMEIDGAPMEIDGAPMEIYGAPTIFVPKQCFSPSHAMPISRWGAHPLVGGAPTHK